MEERRSRLRFMESLEQLGLNQMKLPKVQSVSMHGWGSPLVLENNRTLGTPENFDLCSSATSARLLGSFAGFNGRNPCNQSSNPVGKIFCSNYFMGETRLVDNHGPRATGAHANANTSSK